MVWLHEFQLAFRLANLVLSFIQGVSTTCIHFLIDIRSRSVLQHKLNTGKHIVVRIVEVLLSSVVTLQVYMKVHVYSLQGRPFYG